MTTVLADPTMSDIYPFPAIRATQIARMSEQNIGDFKLTAGMAEQMSEDDIGLLIANCGSMERIHEKLLDLAATDYSATFVVVMQSKKMLAVWYNAQAKSLGERPVPESKVPNFWVSGCCVFTTPEGLSGLSDSGQLSSPVAGILMVDPYLSTHNCRVIRKGRYTITHDRPQFVLNFRTDHVEAGVLPPLIFFAVPPAKSLNTKPAESVYGLATWWYADGKRLRVGEPPTVS